MLGLRATRLLSAEVKCLSNSFFVSQIHKVFTKIKLFSFNQDKLWLISLWRQIMTTSKECCALMAAVSPICNALQSWLAVATTTIRFHIKETKLMTTTYRLPRFNWPARASRAPSTHPSMTSTWPRGARWSTLQGGSLLSVHASQQISDLWSTNFLTQS